MSFLEGLAENMRQFAGKTALEFIDPPLQSLTYAELDERLRGTIAYLQALGVQHGDRIALQLPKCLEFILLHLATVRLGAISLPLNPAYPPAETEYFLQDSGARLFFTTPPAAAALEPVLPGLDDLQDCLLIDPDDPENFTAQIGEAAAAYAEPPQPAPEQTAVIIYTSGTTGRPKGAEITHSNLSANLAALHSAWGWRSDDVLLHALPIFHVHGLFVALLGALYAGATALLMRSFDPQKTLLTLVERECTVFMAVPTIHRRLLAVPEADKFDLSGMRLITSGSDRLPDELFTGFQRAFGYTLLERYGMSETNMNMSNPLEGERRIGSVGRPLPGVEARVVDPETGELLPEGQVGEVQIRGPHVFKGYWGRPEVTAEAFTSDGWLHTGDLGFREPDGYYTLCGRAKDLIITGGMNVYPPEVERVLAEHPDVSASAVIGCPDREWGERVTAVVVCRQGRAIGAEALIEFCRERLAPYKSPKGVFFREDLPRNAMGKVQKAILRAELCSKEV